MTLKTQPAMIPMLLTAFLPLTACEDFNSGGLRTDPLPTDVAAPCKHPFEIKTGGDWEIYAGRLGDELIKCGQEKAIAVDAYNGVAGIVSE